MWHDNCNKLPTNEKYDGTVYVNNLGFKTLINTFSTSVTERDIIVSLNQAILSRERVYTRSDNNR